HTSLHEALPNYLNIKVFESGGYFMTYVEALQARMQKIQKGGHEKYHRKNEEKGKLFVRKRLQLLFDEDLDIEDAFFANCMDDSLPSDGVVTGIGRIN